MKPVLVDTDILSYFFKGNPTVADNFSAYLELHSQVNVSIITYYEIISGLEFRKAAKQLKAFQNFLSLCNVLPVTEKSADISAKIYSSHRKHGIVIDDIDLLIAAIAIENKLAIASNNEKHFGKIKGLRVENGSLK